MALAGWRAASLLGPGTRSSGHDPRLYNSPARIIFARERGGENMRLKAFFAFAIAFVCTLTLPVSGQTTKIGVITSLTGSLAAFGEAHKNGYAIALDEINA